MSTRLLIAMAVLGCVASVRPKSEPAQQLHEDVSTHTNVSMHTHTQADKFFDQGGSCCGCHKVVIKGGWLSKDSYADKCADEAGPTKYCGPNCSPPEKGVKCWARQDRYGRDRC
mmetsp:Transcript_116549/g.163881  ORF Transcript_116549/g.163881 Transcript_116549/m.163881 type:complete len:114 (+) Transcript_116549:48-389(+)